jgi:hypothetical protein
MSGKGYVAIGLAGTALVLGGFYAMRMKSMAQNLTVVSNAIFNRTTGKVEVTTTITNPTAGAAVIRRPYVEISWLKPGAEKSLIVQSIYSADKVSIPAHGSIPIKTELGFNRQTLMLSTPGLAMALLAGSQVKLEVKTLVPVVVLGQDIPLTKSTIESLGY